MPAQPLPERCIWCLRTTAEVPFNESHIVPAALGNAVQTLPPGVVCQPCNSSFGGKMERALIEDRTFGPYRWYSDLRNARTGRIPDSPIFGPPYRDTADPRRPLKFTISAGRAGVTIDVQSPMQRQFTTTYTDREMRLLSRAYHKMAFEGLTWLLYVYEGDLPSLPQDPFDARFDAVRRWVRDGQPMTMVRPVLHGPYGEARAEFDMLIWEHEGTLVAGFDFFGDQYAVSLTSPPDRAWPELKAWAEAQWLVDGVDALWGIGYHPNEGNTAFVIALPGARG